MNKKQLQYITALLLGLFFTLGMQAQNTSSKARQVLDKTASTVNRPGGATANFTLKSDANGTVSGTIAIKGNKFRAVTPKGVVWYDGKTQWTYMKANDEVNVSAPNAKQQAQMNPYHFITLYKKGYAMSMKTLSTGYEVHLTAESKKTPIAELYITVSKGYLPTQVRYLANGSWSTITVSNFKAAKLSDSEFRFQQKDYPTAEVIDLR